MIKHKWIGAVSALLMAVAVLAMIYVGTNPAALASWQSNAQPAYVSAMDKSKVMRIQIAADEKDWAQMLETATAEEYIPATVIIDGVKIENVGIRPKGNSSLSMVANDSTTDRYSFKIEFDHYISGQTWLGLDKIAINNMQGDASYMKEYLSYDIMADTGVAVPLYAFSDISVNGEPWGFYLAVEVLEDSYINRVYGNDHGQLYKPESMGMRGEGRMNEFLEGAGDNPQGQDGGQQAQNNNRLPDDGWFGGMGGMASGGVSLQYTGDDVSQYTAIFENCVLEATKKDNARLVTSLKKLSAGTDVDDVVDVEAVLRYFAAHTVVVNLDSYVSNMGHNYYLYEKDGRLTILPWDYNLAFGGFQSGDASAVVNFPIDTPVSGVSLADRPLLGQLLDVPEYLALYHSYLREIVDGYFDSGKFARTVDALDAMIASYVKNDPTAFSTFDTYTAAIPELKKLGLLRAESIRGQLDGTVPSTNAAQIANPDALIDSSSLNLSALGSQGGMMGGGGFGGPGNQRGGMDGEGNPSGGPFGMGGMPDLDRATMQSAMEILRAAGTNELSEDQRASLAALGLTGEQITQLQTMSQGWPGGNRGGPPGGMNGDNRGGPPGQGAAQNDSASAVVRQPAGFGAQPSALTAGFDTNTWIFVGSCLALLLAGLSFVLLFRRRRRA